MPARVQGTVLRTDGQPIVNLKPSAGTSPGQQRRELDFLQAVNAEHEKSHPGYSELSARIASYELAFKLQTTAPEALDLSKEDPRTLEMYGINAPKPTWHPLAQGPAAFGRQCLTARRLVERGVRFVQIYSGIRPNSPPQTTSVSSSRPRCSRSASSAAIGWSTSGQCSLKFSSIPWCPSQVFCPPAPPPPE